jgi:hypothetical protein
VLWSAPAAAWGDQGHKIVCEVAMRVALPSTRAEIRRLIKIDSEFDFFSDACTWPDHPRKRPDEHFLNLPRTSTGLASDNCGGATDCVVTAIAKDFDVLSSKSSSQRERLASLKFIGHWVGDVHQPLHVSFKDDKGGNAVNASGECHTNLHSVWDTCLVLIALGEDVDAAVERLMATITPTKIETWAQSDPMDWANESFSVARRAETRYCLQQGASCNAQIQGVKVDQAYINDNVPIVREQLQKAGVRLAHLLDKALAKGGN